MTQLEIFSAKLKANATADIRAANEIDALIGLVEKLTKALNLASAWMNQKNSRAQATVEGCQALTAVTNALRLAKGAER